MIAFVKIVADAYDAVANIIYELKPNNSRSIKQGIRQLKRYARAHAAKNNGIAKLVLVLY